MKMPGHDHVVLERYARIKQLEVELAEAKKWSTLCYDPRCECFEEFRANEPSRTTLD